MRTFPTLGVVVFLMVLLITLIIAGCTNSVNVQTKSAKARLAVTQARGSPAVNSPDLTPAPEPSVRYELAESTGNATCDNILKNIYPLVNVAIAEEEKQEKLLLEILGEVEKAQDDLEAGQLAKDELAITRANLTYQQAFVQFQQINGDVKKAREDVKQQKAVLANAKKSCTGVNFEGTTQGDPLADEERNNAANNPTNNHAEENETPECRALRNAERQLDNARRDRNAKENALQRLENDKEEKENEKQDEEKKADADQDNEKIAILQRDIEKIEEDIASTQDDIAKRTEDIDRFKALTKEKRTTCQGGANGANNTTAGTTNANQTNNATQTCTSVATRKVEAELEKLRRDLAELEEDKTQKEEELDRANDEDKDNDIERLENEIDDLDEDINTKEDDIRDLEKDLKELQERC